MGASLSEGAQDGMPTCAIRLRRLDDVMHDEASVPIEVLSGDVGAHPNSCSQLATVTWLRRAVRGRPGKMHVCKMHI
jgi:hypothetical protein